MKTRTLVSLVLGFAFLAPVPLVGAAETSVPGNPPPRAVSPPATNPQATTAAVPSEFPETAAVVLLPQPAARLPDGIPLGGWMGELVKLAEVGIDQGVLLSFIDSAGTFNLGASQIVYLHDIGVSSEVITTILQHDTEVATGVRQVTAGAPPTPMTFHRQVLPVRNQKTSPTAGSSGARPTRNDLEQDPEWLTTTHLALAEPLDIFDDWDPTVETVESSPVRKPYPVQLTSPIVVFRAQGRVPNLTLLRPLP